MVIEFQDFPGLFDSWSWKNPPLITEKFCTLPMLIIFLSPAWKNFLRSEEVHFSMLVIEIFPLVSNPGYLSENSGLGTALNPWFAPPPPHYIASVITLKSAAAEKLCDKKQRPWGVCLHILYRTADCAAPWRNYSPAAHADVSIVRQPMPTWLVSSSPCRGVCSTAVCSASGHVCSIAVSAAPWRVCSTAACAAPGSAYSLAAFATARGVCSVTVCAAHGRLF